MTGAVWPDEDGAAASIRVDKWLWHARFFKTRSLAARQVSEGHVRVNSVKISKPARSVAPGDVLTFPQADTIRVVRILALGTRRGPAPEAQALYEDLSPPEAQPRQRPLARGGPRPTKKERRRLVNSRPDPLD
ncbi:RNA-binding S4 domain-containing protein [Tropicimonas sp. IMCC6043]|uniref:RNA-binding S4 domain-containing protein n=1 Tax=Tropicimonas sp. IMCC6043 TaxID=2510645 RepID=UPI00101CD9C3|nr:RNA-binding S4 domain-containing protein [Tropicimonas sp. IMCC6043]RYH06948.1 RNA-binding S4 domain-containing protein [Tropicimonas sp. IMCC6043]